MKSKCLLVMFFIILYISFIESQNITSNTNNMQSKLTFNLRLNTKYKY
jgi:hypothetical protein